MERFVLHKKKYPYLKNPKTKLAEPLSDRPPQPARMPRKQPRGGRLPETGERQTAKGASFDLDWQKTERVGCDIVRVQRVKADLSESVDEDGELKDESNRREEALSLILRSDERAPHRIKEKIKRYVEAKNKRGFLEINNQVVEPVALAAFERHLFLPQEAARNAVVLIEQDQSGDERDSQSQEPQISGVGLQLQEAVGFSEGLAESNREKKALFKAFGLRQSNFASLNID